MKKNEVIFLFLLFIFNKASCQLLLKKEDIKVLIGREVHLNPSDLVFNTSDDAVCKVEIVSNEPMTQQVGLIEPQVFDCAFRFGSVKYVHHGSPLLLNDTVKLRAFKFLKEDTISEFFDLLIIVENSSYNVIQPLQPLVIKEFLGISEPIDENILNFNFSREEGAICKVRMSRHILQRPAHGKIILGKEKRSIDVIKRRCDDFLQLGLRYEHLAPPSPNIDFILIIVEVTDPYINGGDLESEWYHIPVLIEPGFPNLHPKASFSGMYLMDVDQFIITAITPAVLSATDSETPSADLIFNISKPLLHHQGSIVHLSDHTRSVTSFRQRDLNNFDIAYKPPARSFKDRQMFEIGFVICDTDFAYSDPFTMHIAIRPAITTAPRVSMNIGIVLLEGQSRPLRINNLEIVDSDNINDVKIFITGGLHHGHMEVNNSPAVSFMQKDIVSGSVIYYHDDSDSTRDSIHLRIYDGTHSTHTKVPITIIPKDDNPPILTINIGLKVSEGGNVQITSSTLRAVDHDTSDEFITFIVSKQPLSGKIWKKYAWEKVGSEIQNFTQRDISKGLIYYHHDANEVFADSFEVILKDMNKEPNMSPPYHVSVRIMPVGDDPPKRDPASLFSLEVLEVDIGILGSHHLRFMDVDSQDNEILYSITTSPRFIGSFAHADPGKIVLVSDEVLLQKSFNITPVKNFTQEHINHQKVAYIPPLDEIGPNPLYLQFIFSVKDKDSNVVSGQIFNITILPVNNKIPQLHTGELLVEEGSSTLLSTNELSVYDPDTLTSDLQMSLFTIPLHGSLRRSEQPLRVGDLMSLDDILTLRLEYVHDGSESLKDGFKVGVNDGLHFVSGTVRVSIEPVDDENPVWRKNLLPRISIDEGGHAKLTSQLLNLPSLATIFEMLIFTNFTFNKSPDSTYAIRVSNGIDVSSYEGTFITEVLAATDVDTEDSSLYFILTEAPSYGSIMLEKHKVNRFTQKDVLTGEVEYIHSGQEIGPNPKEDSLTFIVTDKPFPRLKPHDSHKVLVTILPVNTRPPRLYFKRAILVEEGQSVVITEDNLSATDDDTFPAELLLVITRQPEYGYLENSRPTPGYEKSSGSKKISAFPLQDVNDGFISFVQYNHSGVEPESDGFEVCVTDGIHNSTSILIYVSIILLNDEIPVFHVSNITVNEGEKYVFDNESITASDEDYPGDILILSVKNKPKYGRLTHFVQAVNKGPMIEIPFDQLPFENFDGMVYKHDGSENFVDTFILSLSDGLHEILQPCFVIVYPVNDESPELLKNLPAKNVEIHGSFILSSAVLLAKDEDSAPNEIYFNIMNPPSFGVFEKKNAYKKWELLEPVEFSQEDINLNLIRYKHTSDVLSNYEDSFTFIISDGVHESSSAVFMIKLVDSGKTNFTVINHGAYVIHGGDVILNSSLLYATDSSSKIEDIFFHVIKPPVYGHLIFNNDDKFYVTEFTVFDLANNLLSYKHNESAKVTSDSIYLQVTNGVIIRNITFNITITGVVNKIPILEVILPLHANPLNPETFTITPQHLLSYQPSTNNSNIIYLISKHPKFGSIVYDGKLLNPSNFSQEDIEKGWISYSPFRNTSLNDQFLFKVTNNKEEGYLLDGKLMLKPTIYNIYVNASSSAPEPVLLINPPSDLEKVWNNQLGFAIHSYNLKATYSNSHPGDIKFYVYKYLEHGFIFHLKEQKVIRAFTQEDINEQFIVLILKHGFNVQDYFTFHVAVDKITFRKEYRMDFHWAVVFFPFPEYSVCEDAVALNVEIHRRGNSNISSYVTVASFEQTAKEGLDFVSRRINKIQFDPGITSTIWKIMIVQDELEEAPIEQLKIILSDPENCMINQNQTIVSIYDLDRGACSQIPVENPQKHPLKDISNINLSFDSDEAFDDDYDSNNAGFPMACNQNIYGLLHFKQSTQSLFQCDGKKWIPWIPKNNSNAVDFEPLPPSHSDEIGNQDKTDNVKTTAAENSTKELKTKESESTSDVPEVEYCSVGWKEYSGKCYKWYKQPSIWTEAQKVCESYEFGELVTVESVDHNNWLLQLARGKPYWIGLHASSDGNEWMYKVPNDVPYQNWKKGFPRLPVNGEMKHRCVLVRGSGYWINKNCDLHDHSYICSIPLNSLS